MLIITSQQYSLFTNRYRVRFRIKDFGLSFFHFYLTCILEIHVNSRVFYWSNTVHTRTQDSDMIEETTSLRRSWQVIEQPTHNAVVKQQMSTVSSHVHYFTSCCHSIVIHCGGTSTVLPEQPSA